MKKLLDLTSGGDRGEFFTPRNACKMAVEMLDPQPDQRVIEMIMQSLIQRTGIIKKYPVAV